MAKKANGEGSIYFESSRNKYRAQLIDPAGKKITKRFDKKSDAIEWLSVIKAEIYKETYVPASNITVGEWTAEYLLTYSAPNVKKSSQKRYIQTAQHFSPISDVILQSLTAHAVQKFYANLPPMADSTKHKIHRLLKAVITKAHALGMIKKNIMLNVSAPKIKNARQIEILTQEEIEALLKTTRETNPKYYTFFILAIATGCRISEMLGLKISAVHDEHIVVDNNLTTDAEDNTTKTAAGTRKITLSRKVIAMLRAESNPSLSEYVFHTRNGTPWRIRNAERAWTTLMERAGNVHKPFHSLRHTHATRLLSEHVPLLEVSKRLGHSKASLTLELYGHAIPGYDKTLGAKVDEIFFKNL